MPHEEAVVEEATPIIIKQAKLTEETQEKKKLPKLSTVPSSVEPAIAVKEIDKRLKQERLTLQKTLSNSK